MIQRYLLPTLLIALSFFTASACGQITLSVDQPAYLDAASAKIYAYGDRVLVEAIDLKPEPLSGAKIRVDRTDKYLILAFKKNPTEIAALISLEPNLYLLPGRPGDMYLVIIAPLDGSPQSFNEVTIPGTPDDNCCDPPPPPPPDGVDLVALRGLSQQQAKAVGDPTIAEALGSGFVQLKPTIATTDLSRGRTLVKAHTLRVMEARPIDPAQQKDWRPYLLAIDKAITDARIDDSKTYAAVIEAIGLGLLEAAR